MSNNNMHDKPAPQQLYLFALNTALIEFTVSSNEVYIVS